MWKSRNGKSSSNGRKIAEGDGASEIPRIVVESPRGSQLPYVDEVDDDDDDGDDEGGKLLQQVSIGASPSTSCHPPPGRNPCLRRNSISFPSQLNSAELDALREQYNQMSDVGISNSASDMEDDQQPPNARVPARSARKKSAMNAEMLKPQDEDLLYTPGSTSPGNSITSINSLASLLKEKMQQGLPSVLRKKKQTKEYKVKAFVGVLFLVIVSLVTLAYVLYHQQVIQRAYFQKIKFNRAKRVMRIFDTHGSEILRARLGTTLNYDKVFPCLPAHAGGDDATAVCLEWMDRARLHLDFRQLHPEVRCYGVRWQSLSRDVAPTDCFEWSSPPRGTEDHWYGGGQAPPPALGTWWPLERGSFPLTAFVTGEATAGQWGNVLKRYFINSRGATITVDDDVPLFVSLRDDDRPDHHRPSAKVFCMQARHDAVTYASTPPSSSLPSLNYTVCTGPNMTILHSYMSEKSLWDGLKQADIDTINSLLTEPVWQITTVAAGGGAAKDEMNEAAVYNYTEDVIALGFLKQGHVVVNEFWQNQMGDLTLDTDRFPSLQDTVDVLHRRGFRIVLTIQPFVSTESVNFAECVRKRLLVSQRGTRHIPALTSYRSAQSAGLLDITNDGTVPWLQERLLRLQNAYNIDAFYLDLGSAHDMPRYRQCDTPLRNPDRYKSLFTGGLQAVTNVVGVSGAVERPRPPTFVSLPNFESSWSALQTVIPTVLMYGVIGYPFLVPGAVGGDVHTASPSSSATVEIELPDKELYMRWLQLSTFLPVIKFTYLPSKYGDDKLLDMAKILTTLRRETVTPMLKRYARESLDSGLPLIRPLWMLDPADPACHNVIDEFAVGDEIIAAPVLYPGVRVREVYLPAGVWKDGIDGSLRKGSRWIHDYRVADDQVAYFVKMPDNTRF